MAKSVFDSKDGYREPVYIPIDFDLIKEGLKSHLMNSGYYDEIVRIIVELDLSCADWDITEKLIAHFKALEIEMMKEENCGPVEPKKIK